MQGQELLLVSIVSLSFGVFFYRIYMEYGKWPKLSWYERGIGGYSIDGGGASASSYLNTEVNPFDYPFSPMPEGTFNLNQPYIGALSWLFALVALTTLAWVTVNVPDLSFLAIIYFSISVFILAVGLAELIAPKKTTVTAMVGMGYGAYAQQILLGLAIGGFVIILGASGFQIMTESMQIKDMPVASLILSVAVIPTVEELAARDAIGMSIAEEYGWVAGAIIPSVIFAIFHAYVYNLETVLIFNAFIFGVLAQIADYKYKSILPGLSGHMLINFVALMMNYGLR